MSPWLSTLVNLVSVNLLTLLLQCESVLLLLLLLLCALFNVLVSLLWSVVEEEEEEEEGDEGGVFQMAPSNKWTLEKGDVIGASIL